MHFITLSCTIKKVQRPEYNVLLKIAIFFLVAIIHEFTYLVGHDLMKNHESLWNDFDDYDD